MAKVLNQASRTANTRILAVKHERFSRFPVQETMFWTEIYKAAKDPKKAAKVLEELQEIEGEPCIENDRVFQCVTTAKSLARLTLLKLQKN